MLNNFEVACGDGLNIDTAIEGQLITLLLFQLDEIHTRFGFQRI